MITVSEPNVRRPFQTVNIRKATGPGAIPGSVFKACADQLAPVLTTILNLSLAQSVITMS